MKKECIVEIQGMRYQGVISEDEKNISIFNVVNLDDVDFLGRFMLDGDNLIEVYPMTNRKVIIGEIVHYS